MRKTVPPAAAEQGVRWRAIVIAIAAVLTYSNSLSGPFILDDQSAIVENAEIRDLSRLDRVFQPAPNSSESGRPIVNLSFALTYAADGLNVRGYHVWNIAVHLVCALLVFGIVRRTLELPSLRDVVGASSSSRTLAFAVALLWAVHPLNSEVVDYLTQRTESMMAAFLLLTLYAAIRARTSVSGPWQVLAVVSCALGMACKESMVTAPVLVALFDRVYMYGSWKEAFRARGRLYLGLVAGWIVLAGLVLSSPRAAVGGFSSGVSVWTYLLNQTVMITEYLRLTIWPSSLVVFYGWPLSLTLGDVAGYAVLVLALLTVTAVALVRAPRWGFLGAWFFITLAPTSSLVPIATEVGAERRMYLPLIALAILVVIAGHTLTNKAGRKAPPPAVIILGVIVFTMSIALAATTFVRNREYASSLTLARTVVERRPTPIAHHILGEQLLIAGQDDEAMTHLRLAVEGGDSRARFGLGGALFDRGRKDEALEQLDAFVQTAGKRLVPRWLEPPVTEVLTARVVMAEEFAERQRWPEAAAQAALVVSSVPSHSRARRVLAAAMFAQQRWPEAVREYREYLRSNPRDLQSVANFGVALVAIGNLNEAVDIFRRAVDIAPTNPEMKRLLEMALRDRATSAP